MISGNIGPKITASLTIQSFTMMIVQIDYGRGLVLELYNHSSGSDKCRNVHTI